ncbi:MAG: phenylalanine--tRNA ligase subunit beta, partial [Lachnospiraceae bacterium]|nr:phenylalanine--tRNA ligase subunit beta [Lachnospiraceae bacterium]
QVDVGSETLQIVTGAPNVEVGALVPVVLDGGKVAGGHAGGPLPEEGVPIKAGKLRGVDSYGMMCSIEELGSDRNFYPEAPENGIYIFKDGVKPGDDAVEALGLHDTVFEYEITSNRVDCYSILGIAREAAATFRKPFVPPVVPECGNDEKASDYISVEVKDTDLCSRYCARVVKDIKIGPSPQWMQRRLSASGIRPINNLVDITNYVMEEYGQPMHAFDLDTIAGKKIIVRRAADGDRFQTLDGQERILDKDVLMICDAEKEIGIAGIMGGENSKITDSVNTVVFESACFNGPNIRKSAKRIGLRTDASGKFEKGLDPANALAAINRACALIEELNCGTVIGGVVDVCQPLKEEVKIPFLPDKYNKLLGTDISREDMLSYFGPLEIRYDEADNMLHIPSFRQDLLGQADIAEEVARFFGYDNIPTTLPGGEGMEGKLSYAMRIEAKARDVAEYSGFSQGMSYSFESPKVFDMLRMDADDPLRKAVTISNPLGEDFSVMRTISLNGMLTSLATNFKRRNKNVKLYEIGNIYLPKCLPLTELPDERMQFTLGFYGDDDFFTMKGVAENFFAAVGMKEAAEYDPKSARPYLHPGRQADIIYKGVKLGYLGEVHPLVCNTYGIKTRAYVCVLDLPSIIDFTSFDRKYEGLARFPAVTRDISMVVPQAVLAGDIEKMIRQRGGKILESAELFDIYEGDQIKAGFKSIAYALSFRDKNKTLADDEVNAAMKKILNGLESLGIELRS